MTISVLKMHFRKLFPKVINYRDFKKFGNESFMVPYIILSVKSRLTTAKTLISFLKVAKMFLTNRHPEKRSIFVGTINLSLLKHIQKPLCKEHVSEKNSQKIPPT